MNKSQNLPRPHFCSCGSLAPFYTERHGDDVWFFVDFHLTPQGHTCSNSHMGF